MSGAYSARVSDSARGATLQDPGTREEEEDLTFFSSCVSTRVSNGAWLIQRLSSCELGVCMLYVPETHSYLSVLWATEALKLMLVVRRMLMRFVKCG
jgi:hypothetical protein